MQTEQRTRAERDSMGEMQVPTDALYGASTQRAVLNFPVSALRFNRRFIRALGLIKLVAAEVNRELGLLEADRAEAIIAAAREVVDGKWDDHFVIDVFQTGSGTSTNMNANEVIANLAIERLGGERGARGLVHPNDHVNIGQSSNDVIPTAIQVAALIGIQDDLIPACEELRDALMEKSREFWPIIKTGRTHLQDATPIRLGQEFLGYAGQMDHGIKRLRYAQQELGDVPLGGTAVGTGVNTHPEFAQRVCARLSEVLGVKIWETDNHFQAQNSLDALVATSGMVRTVAVSLFKICNDIRWMASGPRAGIFELLLPEVQPGSSIMPGQGEPGYPRVARAGRRADDRERYGGDARGYIWKLRAERDDAGERPQPPRGNRPDGLGHPQLHRPMHQRHRSHRERPGDGGEGPGYLHGPCAHHRLRRRRKDRQRGVRHGPHNPRGGEGTHRAIGRRPGAHPGR